MAGQSRASRTYLADHYFNDQALRRFALDELVKATRKGRLIAFAGSMVTVGHGYPDWTKLIELGIKVSKQYVRKYHKDLTPSFNKFCKTLENEMARNEKFEGRVLTSVIGAWLDNKTGKHDAGQVINERLAAALLAGSVGPSETDSYDEHGKVGAGNMVAPILDKLKINRIVTTNYDKEFEYHLAGIRNKKSPDKKEAELKSIVDDQLRSTTIEGGRLRIKLDDGNVMVSDALRRDRLDQLIDFIVGSTDIDYHIMHLHGRIDQPETMVVSYRDYDRLYRIAGASKLPFEHTLSMMYTANPVLFIGLGMSEQELNTALQELVGNQPYRRPGRLFLLWNAPKALNEVKTTKSKKKRICGFETTVTSEVPGKPEKPAMTQDEVKANFRLDKLHRLGVLTIFDDELFSNKKTKGAALSGINHDDTTKSGRAVRVAESISNLEKFTKDERAHRGESIDPKSWRDGQFKRSFDVPICYTWHFRRHFGTENGLKAADIKKHHLWVNTSRPGTKKAAKALATGRDWCYGKDKEPIVGRHALFINTSLRLDTDSILELICKYLHEFAIEKNGTANNISRQRRFKTGTIFRPVDGKEILLIFKGLERLFGKNGQPLSAEMDQFFRDYLKAAISDESGNFVRIAVFGTRRMRLYFSKLERQVAQELKAKPNSPTCSTIIKLDRDDESPSGYLLHLKEEFFPDPGRKTHADVVVGTSITDDGPALADDRRYARLTFALLFASEKFLSKFPKGSAEENIAFAALTVMAFIGQPVEAEVLFHAPRITDCLDVTKPIAERRATLTAAIENLAEFKLIHEIGKASFESDHIAEDEAHRPRYALHLSLQAEMRERYGVPLSEAVLSTSFNMSLYASQPADAAIPDPAVHDELGRLIDWLIGAYKDKDVYNPKDVIARDASMEFARAAAHLSACLRAALAIMRGFYSTSALLTLDLGDVIVSDRRDGALTEHADRIERLIVSFNAMREQRTAYRRKLRAEGYADTVIKERLGPEPMYPDELVWLHNERGVVKLAQGDLYEARFSFRDAEKINRRYVEYDDRSHNWRRIWLNQLVVDIDRGKLAEAEDRIGRIENSIGIDCVNAIREKLGEYDPKKVPEFPLHISSEDCLAVALVTGYRALIMHLRGELNTADAHFKLAIIMLENLDEQRACALIRRHHASLRNIVHGTTASVDVAKLAVAGAESVQQMDIAYGARITRNIEHASSDKAEKRRRAMRTFSDALDYAVATDVHRVGVEARRALANLKLDNGDFESALEHACHAMATASRFGMSLQKLSIRILIGRILYARDNREAGQELIKSAILLADRIGYQRAVESAQTALAEMNQW